MRAERLRHQADGNPTRVEARHDTSLAESFAPIASGDVSGSTASTAKGLNQLQSRRRKRRARRARQPYHRFD
jgi:hypothetical protein